MVQHNTAFSVQAACYILLSVVLRGRIRIDCGWVFVALYLPVVLRQK